MSVLSEKEDLFQVNISMSFLINKTLLSSIVHCPPGPKLHRGLQGGVQVQVLALRAVDGGIASQSLKYFLILI